MENVLRTDANCIDCIVWDASRIGQVSDKDLSTDGVFSLTSWGPIQHHAMVTTMLYGNPVVGSWKSSFWDLIKKK